MSGSPDCQNTCDEGEEGGTHNFNADVCFKFGYIRNILEHYLISHNIREQLTTHAICFVGLALVRRTHKHFRTHCGCQVCRETKTHMQSSCAFRAIQQCALFAFRLHSINISSESVSSTRPCRPRGQLRSPPSSSFAVLYIN